jgi:hypothetical protein
VSVTKIDSMSSTAARPAAPKAKRKWRGWWLRQLHTWHWMSAALSLVGMLLFAVTGITLNHAASIPGSPATSNRAATLPPPLLRELKTPPATDSPLPPASSSTAPSTAATTRGGKPGEWSDAEVYVALPRPGGDAWVSIDRTSGAIMSEVTSRGWIAYLNDLHKGRNTGGAWSWFLDIFAGACIVFTLTGLLLLQLHARHRRSTWPIVAAGVVVPLALILVFIH